MPTKLQLLTILETLPKDFQGYLTIEEDQFGLYLQEGELLLDDDQNVEGKFGLDLVCVNDCQVIQAAEYLEGCSIPSADNFITSLFG